MCPLEYFWNEVEKIMGAAKRRPRACPRSVQRTRAIESEAIARMRTRDPENKGVGKFSGAKSSQTQDTIKQRSLGALLAAHIIVCMRRRIFQGLPIARRISGVV